MDKETRVVFESAKKHLGIRADTETDYDSYGVSTSVVVRLVWVHDDGKVEELSSDSAYIGRESRG